MKKIVITMIVFSVVVFGLSSSSFAANIPQNMEFHHFANHPANYRNGNFKTLNLSAKQKSELMSAVKDNSADREEIQAELKSTMGDLRDLYAQKKEMTENNTMDSTIDQQISNLETIISNYHDQLSYLQSKQEDALQDILSNGQYNQLLEKIKNHGQMYKKGLNRHFKNMNFAKPFLNGQANWKK